jgi:hypothetical protein
MLVQGPLTCLMDSSSSNMLGAIADKRGLPIPGMRFWIVKFALPLCCFRCPRTISCFAIAIVVRFANLAFENGWKEIVNNSASLQILLTEASSLPYRKVVIVVCQIFEPCWISLYKVADRPDASIDIVRAESAPLPDPVLEQQHCCTPCFGPPPPR